MPTSTPPPFPPKKHLPCFIHGIIHADCPVYYSILSILYTLYTFYSTLRYTSKARAILDKDKGQDCGFAFTCYVYIETPYHIHAEYGSCVEQGGYCSGRYYTYIPVHTWVSCALLSDICTYTLFYILLCIYDECIPNLT